MKYVALILLFLCSCSKQEAAITNVVYEKNKINSAYIKNMHGPEKAMLTWYLYAYGNECDKNSSKVKCQILKELNIEDECNDNHLNNLLQWFSNDMLAVYKLNKCPNLTLKSAIQNTFERIVLIRNADTLSIEFSVKGLNTIQEKSWNVNQTDVYIIKNRSFKKIVINE